MSTLPQPAGPHAGKRLSFWRVLLGLVVVAAVAAVAVFGFRFFVVDQARASTTAPWFAGYVDATLTPEYAFETPETRAQGDVVLSFIVAASPTDCTPSWGAAYSLDAAAEDLDMERRIARLRQLGGDVVVSFGGAINAELATACSSVEDLTEAYGSVVDRYSLSTIDLDVEADDLTDSVAGERRATAIAALQAERAKGGHDLAVWVTLPTMPTGLTADGTHLVDQMLAAGVDLAGVNVMTMDYGIDLGTETMGDAAVDALNAVHGQLSHAYSAAGEEPTDATLWSKLGATPMIGQNDVPGEVFTLDDAHRLNEFAQQQQLGRLSAWSLNRDRSCGPNYLDTITVSNLCSGVEQGDETFAEVLATGLSAGGEAGTPTASGQPASGDLRPTPTATTGGTGRGTPGEANPGHEGEPAADDPATSPYPIWSPGTVYLSGSKVVWHGTVYSAKWWTRGDRPDDPVADTADTAWTLIGPVLPGETPYTPPTLPAGAYPEWSGTSIYEEGDRVLFENIPFEAKWWTQGDSPAATERDSDGSPWVALTAAQIAEVAAATATPPAGAPPAGG
ncbi:glycosyl hydrolase family 18 [Herbiconiux sp. VKM Ac-1786]|uniref:chitinase n=1 Tax=Herbiconiux sp. VKM Ac-1786 TaxID=2783824 RepID=UPI00188A60BE|nr:chitinase [Herbiconiux sp. VKM Ac-1786]MBF4571167.1 glycosyl hydrolase family 18 [Herbiconiux sp. VKM Ac-1786]